MSPRIPCSYTSLLLLIGFATTTLVWLPGCGGRVYNCPDVPGDGGTADGAFLTDIAAPDLSEVSPADTVENEATLEPDGSPWENDSQARVCAWFGEGWKSTRCRNCLEEGPPSFTQFESAMKAVQDLACEASLGCVYTHCLRCTPDPCESDTCKCIARCMPRGNQHCIKAWQDHMSAVLQTCSSVCK